ncbi:MAG: hypothetical protein RRC34_01130 [Lentisphaeria bacterium]|nr:hypothetical protein [Lentisphaeria bacterium]
MAPRTLTTTWKNFEKLFRQYEKSGRTDSKKLEAIDDLVRKTNASRITDALATLFVKPYGVENGSILLSGTIDGIFPEWRSKAEISIEEVDDDEVKSCTIIININGVFDFLAEGAAALDKLNTPEARKSFQEYRYTAYMAQMSKLPAKFVLFLLILQEVATLKRITDVEKKGGEIEAAVGARYLQLLWGFKELETFFKRTNGLDLRAEFGILWLESDWFIGQ